MAKSSIGKTRTTLDRKTGKMTTTADILPEDTIKSSSKVDPVKQPTRMTDQQVMQSGSALLGNPNKPRLKSQQTTESTTSTPQIQTTAAGQQPQIGVPGAKKTMAVTQEAAMTREERDAYRASSGQVTPQQGQDQISTPAVGEDYILDVNELTPEQRAIYDQMTPQEQAVFAAIGEEARKTGQDTAEAYADYMLKYEQEKEYREEQQARRQELQEKQDFIAQEQSSQRIEDARIKLHGLKQSMAYIGTLGRPGKSQQYLDAVDNQLTVAQDTFERLKSVELAMLQSRELGNEIDYAAYERQMVLLEDELNRNVSETIQNAINTFDVEVEDIDTEDELEALRIRILDQIDEKTAEFGMGTVEQMKYLVTAAERISKDRQENMKLKNSINADMSAAQGYYVNGLGEPIISSTTGMQIEYPEDPPIDPIFDKETGKLITFSLDENGNIVSTVDQVIDQPTFAQEAINGIVNAVRNGYMTAQQALQVVPQSSQQALLNQLGQLEAQKDTAKPTEWKKDKDSGLFYKTDADGNLIFEDIPDMNEETFDGAKSSNYILSGNVDMLAEQMEYGEPYDCGDQQCGEWYNRAVGKKNGTRVENSYESKTKYIDYSVTQGEPGMGVVYNPYPGTKWEEYGHIGVVSSGPYQGANGEIGYDVISANLYGDEKLTKDFVPESMIASTGGGFVPTTAKEEFEGGTTAGRRGKPDKQSLEFISFERQIKNNVPATLMNSEVELNQLDDRIGSMRQLGLTPEKAALTYMGFDIGTLDREGGEVVSKIVDTIRQIPGELPEGVMGIISNFANAGKMNEAVTLAEKTAYDAIENPKITEPTARLMVERTTELQEIMNDFDDKFGFVKGNINKQLKKYRNDPVATDLLNKMTKVVADMRNELGGTDMTENEEKFLEPLIPNLEDPFENAMQKVVNMESDTLRQLNSYRKQLRLPELNQDSLINVYDREKLYTAGNQKTTTKSVPKEETEGTVQLSPEEQSLYDEIMGL